MSTNIYISPHSYDAGSEPILFLQAVAEKISAKYQTDTKAAIKFVTMRDLRFDIYLKSQDVSAFGTEHIRYVREALKNKDGLDNTVHVLSNQLDTRLRDIAAGK